MIEAFIILLIGIGLIIIGYVRTNVLLPFIGGPITLLGIIGLILSAITS